MQQAVVFGLFETGLGVIRSLGEKGVKVTGIDFKKDIGWYSRYVKPQLCPHPLNEEAGFLKWVVGAFSIQGQRLPVFFTSDDFLLCFSKNREVLKQYFLFNLPGHDFLLKISDKYQQYLLAKETSTPVPQTFVVRTSEEIRELTERVLPYPLFIKGLEVNSWRKKISASTKGFQVDDSEQLKNKLVDLLSKEVPVIVQEMIQGGDTNHYKYCAYVSGQGDLLGEFTLRKIRQNPIRFGVGAAVVSVHDEELLTLGRALFKKSAFRGIGSAEFKRDEKDGKLKLIEINPRYWQQNYLSTACGINFPYINFLDLLDRRNERPAAFMPGVIWVNRYMDFDSYMSYRREGLGFFEWRRSLRGKKVYSDFTWADPLPAFYELGFGAKLLKAPWFVIRKFIR